MPQFHKTNPHHRQQPSHLHEGDVFVPHLPLKILYDWGQRGDALIGLRHHGHHGAGLLPLLSCKGLQAGLLLCIQCFVEPLKLSLDALCSLPGLVLGEGCTQDVYRSVILDG